jgi:hypothetical protein
VRAVCKGLLTVQPQGRCSSGTPNSQVSPVTLQAAACLLWEQKATAEAEVHQGQVSSC